MEDLLLCRRTSGGIKGIERLLHKDCITVNGKRLKKIIKDAECYNSDVIATVEKPFNQMLGLASIKRQSV